MTRGDVLKIGRGRRWLINAVALGAALTTFSVLALPAAGLDLNHAILDDGTCGKVLQLGSDVTASRSNTPSFLLAGDGALSSYSMAIDGVSIGTFNSNRYSQVCVLDTKVLSDGSHQLTGRELSPHSNAITAFSFKVDTVPPPAPTGLRLDAASDSGVLGDNITTATNLRIDGLSSAGLPIHLLEGAVLRGGTVADSTGHWSVTTTALAAGVHTFTAVALDSAANQSAPSTSMTATIDPNAPTGTATTSTTRSTTTTTRSTTTTTRSTTTTTSTTVPRSTTTSTTTTTLPRTTQPVTGGSRVGYWMMAARGSIYPFGQAKNFGTVAYATAIAPRLDGTGYRVTTAAGTVAGFGTAASHGGRPRLRLFEIVTTIAATRSGNGYWLFTNLGRAFAYGDAHFYGDMSHVHLNAPIVASSATATGHGYYMVGRDGGIFAFGDAEFHGSTGNLRLNKPIVGIAPTSDNEGYWLVGADGGVFAFHAPFRGSMGGRRLNKPVVGMVAYGNGYLMVASDGGVFTFSNKPFLGSLAGHPPASPVITIVAFST
jgi:hypothetical protein